MTIQVDSRITEAVETDGVSKRFDFNFPLFKGDDDQGLEVRFVNELGYDIVDREDYSLVVGLENKGGHVLFHVAPEAGLSLVIAGKTPLDQSLDITNPGKFFAQSVERSLDKITSMIQEFVSTLDEETRQRINNDKDLKERLDIRFAELAASIDQRFQGKWTEMSDYLNSLLPMFFCIMRKEIEAFTNEQLPAIIDQRFNEVIEEVRADAQVSIDEMVDDLTTQTNQALNASSNATLLLNNVTSELNEKVPQIDSALSKAEIAATAIAVSGNVFDTPEAGVDPVTGVAYGAYFNVRSSSDESYIDEYQNVGGNAVATGKSYLSSLGVAQQEKSASTIKDASGKNQQEINDLLESSVKIFGARGDGTTSDVVAITTAMSTANQLTFTDGTYLIDSDLTITVPVSFTKKAKLKVTNGSKVYFAVGTCDDVCAHWFSGSNAIQDAVIAAKSVKSVYIRSGVWLLDSPVIIPDAIPYWGISIRGSSESQQYESLASSQSTVLKANSTMNVVIGSRSAWKDASGYYNKVSNMTIDGNKLANYGYINGQQDTLSGVHVQNCLIGGIIFGALTNVSALLNVSSARNARGLILTGNPPTAASTHAVISNSRFRQNDISGVTICQAIGVKFTDSVIESNKTVGIEMIHNNTTDDFYAGSYAFTSNILFERIGMENNPITISIDGTGGAQRPSSIEFKGCNFVGKTTDPLTPLGDIRLKSTRGVFFDRNYNAYMSLNADTNAYAIQIKGYQVNDSDFPIIYGVNAANVQTTKVTDIGDTIEDHLIFANYAAPQKNITTSTTLARNDVAGSIITNSGQAAVDLTITLPNTGYNVSPRYSPSFTFVVLTQQLANKLTFKTQAGSYIIYNGAQRTTIDTGGNGVSLGLSIRFVLTVSAGVQYWLAENISGVWYAS